MRRTGQPGERADVVGEVQLAAVRRGEAEAGFRRHVVHDLQHRAAFVCAGRLVFEKDDGLGVAVRIARARQVAAGDVERCAVRRRVRVIAVRHHADGDARAIDACRQLVHAMLDDALAGRRADVRYHRRRRHDGEHAFLGGQAPERARRHVSFDHALAIGRVGSDHVDAGHARQALQDRCGGHLAVERDAYECAACVIELQCRRDRRVLLRRSLLPAIAATVLPLALRAGRDRRRDSERHPSPGRWVRSSVLLSRTREQSRQGASVVPAAMAMAHDSS